MTTIMVKQSTTETGSVKSMQIPRSAWHNMLWIVRRCQEPVQEPVQEPGSWHTMMDLPRNIGSCQHLNGSHLASRLDVFANCFWLGNVDKICQSTISEFELPTKRLNVQAQTKTSTSARGVRYPSSTASTFVVPTDPMCAPSFLPQGWRIQ